VKILTDVGKFCMRVLELFFGAIGYVAATTTNLKPWKSGSTNATFDKLYRAYMFSFLYRYMGEMYFIKTIYHDDTPLDA